KHHRSAKLPSGYRADHPQSRHLHLLVSPHVAVLWPQLLLDLVGLSGLLVIAKRRIDNGHQLNESQSNRGCPLSQLGVRKASGYRPSQQTAPSRTGLGSADFSSASALLDAATRPLLRPRGESSRLIVERAVEYLKPASVSCEIPASIRSCSS